MELFQPCLLTSGDFSGEFGICCQEVFPRRCPDVPVFPPREQCLPRPLGQPEDDECDSVGVRDQCPGDNALCCFNGCLNVCLTGEIKNLLCMMFNLHDFRSTLFYSESIFYS